MALKWIESYFVKKCNRHEKAFRDIQEKKKNQNYTNGSNFNSNIKKKIRAVFMLFFMPLFISSQIISVVAGSELCCVPTVFSLSLSPSLSPDPQINECNMKTKTSEENTDARKPRDGNTNNSCDHS